MHCLHFLLVALHVKVVVKNCLEGPSVRKFLSWTGQKVTLSNCKQEGVRLTRTELGLLSSLTVLLQIFTTHLLIKVSLELQLSCGARNTF